jgi:drug/metabolite transporter (DMT)-like permease
VDEYLIFAALAIIPMILGHTLLNYALGYVSAPVVATTVLGEPIGSALLAWLILGEVPPILVGLGGVVVLAGIGLVVVDEEDGETTADEAAG